MRDIAFESLLALAREKKSTYYYTYIVVPMA